MRGRSALLVLLCSLNGACIELTEVQLAARSPRLVLQLSNVWRQETEVQLFVQGGVSETGVSRRLLQDSARINGVSYAPADWRDSAATYTLTLPDTVTDVLIVSPALSDGIAPHTITAVPIRLVAPDTILVQPGEQLEITIAAPRDSVEGQWSMRVFTDSGTVLNVSGFTVAPTVMHVSTTLLPPGVHRGHLEVSGFFSSRRTDPPFDILIVRQFSGLIPFRIVQ